VQDYEWNEKIKNTTSIYFTNGVKENPFINNYELEKLKSYGGRSSFNYRTRLGNMPAIFSTGAELNYGDFHASNHGNVDGYADTLRYEDELKSLQSFIFLQADMNLSDKWILNLGASLNYLNYDINRLRDVAADTSYQIKRTFNPEFMPRIGIVGKLTNSLSVHGSISSGFSPPTTEEVRTSDGGINEELEAEKGINYEIGLRGSSQNETLYYDLTAFWMQQKETIVSKTTEFGTVIFENAGSTSQKGIELLLGYAIINDPSRAISLLKIQTAYTHHNFIFKDYVKRSGGENVDYSGNDLTGTSPNISVTTLDFQTMVGAYLNFTYNFTDRIPLNDANSVYADSYQLVTLKAGWKLRIKQKHLLDVSFGIDNLLNEKYSLGNDLNAFGRRYYNPSPERNYFGGLKVYLNKN
ncbi:MAG: TonB-dependent receptor, partial [Cyclobacteriaceae bacterium]|nr:TonB-dependent receptor [Cyclobacteriaceae bacterium]